MNKTEENDGGYFTSFIPSQVTLRAYHENCSNEITRGISGITGWILHFDLKRDGSFTNYTAYMINDKSEEFRTLINNMKKFRFFSKISYFRYRPDFHLFCFQGRMHKEYEPISDILEKYECHFIYPIEVVPEWEKWHLFIKNRSQIKGCIDELREFADVHMENISTFDPLKAINQHGVNIENLITPRQKEILERALSMGYFDTPRKCSLREMSEVLNISHTAINKHIRNIEKKMLKNLL